MPKKKSHSQRAKKAGRDAETAKLVVKAGATALTVAAASNPLTASIALLAYAPELVTYCVPKVFERKSQRVKQWWDRLVSSDDPGKSIEAELEAKRDDPNAQDVIEEAFRDVLNSISDDVVPVIARLTREHLRSGKGVDSYFRGTGKLLADFSGADLNSLKMLINALAGQSKAGVRFELYLRFSRDEPINDELLDVLVVSVADSEVVDRLQISVPNGRHLMQALRMYGLASEPTPRFDLHAGARLETQLVARLQRLLEP